MDSSSPMMLFAGNAHPRLAEDVAHRLGVPLGKVLVSTFSDGEVQIEIEENVRNQEVFVLQPTGAPSAKNLVELLALADALKRASAARVTAVIPYFGYARQDRRPRSARVPITAKLVAKMIGTAGIDREAMGPVRLDLGVHLTHGGNLDGSKKSPSPCRQGEVGRGLSEFATRSKAPLPSPPQPSPASPEKGLSSVAGEGVEINRIAARR